MRKLILLLAACLALSASAQSVPEATKPSITLGLEQDVLPYVLRGFIFTGWTGRDQMRIRFSYAEAQSPGLLLADHLERDRVQAFGISAEYFFKDNFEGIWFGPGVGFWTNQVRDTLGTETLNESVVFSLGGGYNLALTRWLYASPWVALHTRVSGMEPVPMAAGSYQPMRFTPEVSVKLGL